MNDQQADNVRAEYAALVSYFNVVDGFRFTTLGFYLAATGFIVGHGIERASGLLLLGITISLWLMEARNRSQLKNLAMRGIQIERECWGNSGARAYDAFFSRQYKTAASDAPPPPGPEDGYIWRKRVPFTVSYTLALDILFTIVGAYSVYVSVRG